MLDTPLSHHLVQEDMHQVDTILHETISSHLSLVTELGQHLIDSGGKRLRPLVVLLSARALGYQGTQHLQLAAIMELVHTATLLHDDVVDGSAMRRGKATANTLWGNQASVLVGDFLYSRVFQMMLKLRDFEILDTLAGATNAMVSGELQQLMNRHNPTITEDDYLNVVYYKTATLFETASKLGAVISNQSQKIIDAMSQYGKCLGTAFQLIDDLLDYNGNTETIGKNIGDDLAEGKMTMPLIHALQHGTTEQQQVIKQAIAEGQATDIQKLKSAIESTHAIDYTQQRAAQYVQEALAHIAIIPDSVYKEQLEELAQFTIQRNA